MKHLVLAFLLILSLASPAQTGHRRHHSAAPRTKVYVCGGGAAHAYHASDGCACEPLLARCECRDGRGSRGYGAPAVQEVLLA
jgi:hypothetical protein